MSDHDPFEDLARRAGADLRRDAPAGGIQRLRRAQRRRQMTTAGAVGAVAVVLVAGGLFIATRGDGDGNPPAHTSSPPVTTAPTTDPDPTTNVPTTTVPPVSTSLTSTAAPSTTSPATTAPAISTAVTTTSPFAGTPPSAPTTQLAVTFVGGGAGPWAPLGWWDGTGWVERSLDQTASAPPDSPIANVVALGPGLPGGPLDGGRLGDPGEYCAGPELGRSIDLGPALVEDAERRGYVALAVTADWAVQPRPVIAAGLDSPLYQSIGEGLVAGRPDVDPTSGDVTEVVRVDLNGDGIEEVVFGFEHLADTNGVGAAGDFSIVVARLPRPDGTVEDQVIFEHYGEEPIDFPNPGRGGLLTIADLNGDAVMEVVVRSVFWEASVAEAYELQDDRLVRVLVGGCGV